MKTSNEPLPYLVLTDLSKDKAADDAVVQICNWNLEKREWLLSGIVGNTADERKQQFDLWLKNPERRIYVARFEGKDRVCGFGMLRKADARSKGLFEIRRFVYCPEFYSDKLFWELLDLLCEFAFKTDAKYSGPIYIRAHQDDKLRLNILRKYCFQVEAHDDTVLFARFHFKQRVRKVFSETLNELLTTSSLDRESLPDFLPVEEKQVSNWLSAKQLPEWASLGLLAKRLAPNNQLDQIKLLLSFIGEKPDPGLQILQTDLTQDIPHDRHKWIFARELFEERTDSVGQKFTTDSGQGLKYGFQRYFFLPCSRIDVAVPKVIRNLRREIGGDVDAALRANLLRFYQAPPGICQFRIGLMLQPANKNEVIPEVWTTSIGNARTGVDENCSREFWDYCRGVVEALDALDERAAIAGRFTKRAEVRTELGAGYHGFHRLYIHYGE